MLYVQAADLHLHLTEADHSAGLHNQWGQPVTKDTTVLSTVPYMQLLQSDWQRMCWLG